MCIFVKCECVEYECTLHSDVAPLVWDGVSHLVLEVGAGGALDMPAPVAAGGSLGAYQHALFGRTLATSSAAKSGTAAAAAAVCLRMRMKR
jgi:hypothetical protein